MSTSISCSRLITMAPSTDDMESFSDWLSYVEVFAETHGNARLLSYAKSANLFLTSEVRRQEYRVKILSLLKVLCGNDDMQIIGDNAVFIVHGHDNALKSEVARLLEQQNIVPIILYEQTNQGRVLLDKLEQEINRASFAVVLYTKDDMISSSNVSVWRARQNVVFEHGYLIAKLGRDKVCAIKDEGVELMSDISGVAYISRSDSWQIKLLKELEAVGFSVDLNKVKF